MSRQQRDYHIPVTVFDVLAEVLRPLLRTSDWSIRTLFGDMQVREDQGLGDISGVGQVKSRITFDRGRSVGSYAFNDIEATGLITDQSLLCTLTLCTATLCITLSVPATD